MNALLARLTAQRPLARTAKQRGGRLLNTAASFYIQPDHTGPLKEGEVERACAWVKALGAPSGAAPVQRRR